MMEAILLIQLTSSCQGVQAKKIEGGCPVTVYGNDTWPADDECRLSQEWTVGGDHGWAWHLIATEMGTWL